MRRPKPQFHIPKPTTENRDTGSKGKGTFIYRAHASAAGPSVHNISTTSVFELIDAGRRSQTTFIFVLFGRAVHMNTKRRPCLHAMRNVECGCESDSSLRHDPIPCVSLQRLRRSRTVYCHPFCLRAQPHCRRKTFGIYQACLEEMRCWRSPLLVYTSI